MFACRAMPRASRLILAAAVTIVLAATPFRATMAAETHASQPAEQARQPPQPAGTAPLRTLHVIRVQGTNLAGIELEQKQVPGATHLVDGATFQQRAVDNLADALRYVPGVMAQSNAGGDDMVLSIRGSNLNALSYDNAGVVLFQDGLPVTTADGNNHNRMPDPQTASAMIVANGINAMSYGASSLGGAIDVLSRTARNSNPRRLFMTGGSNDRREFRVGTGGVSGRLDGAVELDSGHFAGFREHATQNRDGLHANAGMEVTDAFDLRVFASYIDNRQQLPGALTPAAFAANPWQAEPSYAAGNHQLNVRSSRLAAKGVWEISPDSDLEFGISHEHQVLFHPIVDVFVASSPGPGAPWLDVFSLLVNTRQRTGAGMLRYHLRSGRHDLLAGLDLAHTVDSGGNYANLGGKRGALQDLIAKRARSANLFLLDRWQGGGGWTLVYGAQGVLTHLDDQQVDGVNHGNSASRDRQNRFASFNPRIGLIRKIGAESEVYASAGRLYQSPNHFDLDNARRERGPQASLEAMHGLTYEAGLRGMATARAGGSHWRWNISAYRERIDNEIFSVDDPDAPGISLTANIPRTIHAGIEALVSASLRITTGGDRIEPLLSATWNDFAFQHDPRYGNNRLPAAPRYALHGELLYRSGSGFYAGPTLDMVGPRYADFANTFRVGTYMLAGLRAGRKHGHWEFFAEITNLFDRRYPATLEVQNQAHPDSAMLNPGAPRSVYAGLRLEY